MRLTDIQIAQVAAAAGFGGDSLITAVAVALAESGGDAGNITGDGGTSFGLWQIHWTVHRQFVPAQLTDPNYNAQAAFEVSNGGTYWHPWTTFNTGAYRKYMARAQAAAAQLGLTSPPSYSTLTAATAGIEGQGIDFSSIASFSGDDSSEPQFFEATSPLLPVIAIVAGVVILSLILDL